MQGDCRWRRLRLSACLSVPIVRGSFVVGQSVSRSFFLYACLSFCLSVCIICNLNSQNEGPAKGRLVTVLKVEAVHVLPRALPHRSDDVRQPRRDESRGKPVRHGAASGTPGVAAAPRGLFAGGARARGVSFRLARAGYICIYIYIYIYI